MAHPVRFPEAPTTERPSPTPETCSLSAAEGSRPARNRSLDDCYAWLTRVERRCVKLSKGQRHKTVRRARKQLLHDSVDFSWANQGKLVRYATAYLEGLATLGHPAW